MNGRLGASLDADETLPAVGQTSHHATPTVFAAIALAERHDRDVSELLTAIAAGYEVAARVSLSMQEHDSVLAPTGWRVGGGAAGIIGASVASARILRLSPAELDECLGIASMHVAVPPLKWLSTPHPPLVKTMDSGWHAMAGIAAAETASLGMTGYRAVLEGDDGLWRALAYSGFDGQTLISGLGDHWYVHDSAFKLWPVQHWMRPSLYALTQILRRAALSSSDVQAVTVLANSRTSGPMFAEKQPLSEVACQFSFPHATAMLILGVPPGPKWFDSAVGDSPEAQRLRHLCAVASAPDFKITAERHAKGGLYRSIPGEATVVSRDRTWTARTSCAPGDPWDEQSRLSDNSLVDKFVRMCEPWRVAQGRSAESIEKLARGVLQLERGSTRSMLANLQTHLVKDEEFS